MSLAGKRDGFTTSDLLEAAAAANLKTPKAKSILKEVHTAISAWRDFAEQAKVAPEWTRQIEGDLRRDLKA